MSPSSSASDLSGRDLSGQGAIVTGGTRGIGRTIAMRLRDAGATVVVCGRTEPGDLPADIMFVAADIREPEQATMLVDQAVARLGRLDLLINNAGGGPVSAAADLPPKLANAILRLNLLAPLFVAQAAHRVMDEGLIINIGSVAATRPAPGTAVYAAAKAGLVTLTQALALEWAPRIRVNCVTAGVVRTDDNAHHYGDEAALAAVASTVPLGRMATPDDVANACLLLASPDRKSVV